jgi:hypothetical protein
MEMCADVAEGANSMQAQAELLLQHLDSLNTEEAPLAARISAAAESCSASTAARESAQSIQVAVRVLVWLQHACIHTCQINACMCMADTVAVGASGRCCPLLLHRAHNVQPQICTNRFFTSSCIFPRIFWCLTSTHRTICTSSHFLSLMLPGACQKTILQRAAFVRVVRGPLHGLHHICRFAATAALVFCCLGDCCLQQWGTLTNTLAAQCIGY